MSDRTIQIKKSTTNIAPENLLFGEFATSTVDSNTTLYLGNSSGTALKIYDESAIDIPVFIYNNTSNKYVAKEGLNTNNGQSSRPYLTIQNGLNTCPSLGSVQVESGIYTENLTFSTTGQHLIGTSATLGIAPTTRLNGTISITGSQSSIGYITLMNSASSITINSVSGNDFNFNAINISGSVSTTNVLTVTAMASGYINLSNCDFQNKTLLFSPHANIVFVYITNCRNMKINAASNYIVIVDNNTNFVELSTNNNISVGYNNVTDIISATPVNPGLYLLSDNTTIGGNALIKGSLISYNGVSATLIYLYYNCASSIYLSAKNAVYQKIGSLNWAPTATYPIVSVSF